MNSSTIILEASQPSKPSSYYAIVTTRFNIQLIYFLPTEYINVISWFLPYRINLLFSVNNVVFTKRYEQILKYVSGLS
jgi:hypothetical protein